MKNNKKEDNIAKFVSNVIKKLKIKVSPKTENLLIQIFNFGIVGVIATLIDFAFLYIFMFTKVNMSETMSIHGFHGFEMIKTCK